MDSSPQAYALLIGIDQYLPNKLGYHSLKGCVQDVIHMEVLLRSRLVLPEEHIIKLIAPNDALIEPDSLYNQRHQFPTYTAIVAAFEQLINIAHPSDFIYIYFAGHGAHATSLLVEDKGTDEVLVPMDIGLSQARYLHDVELAYLLQQMGDAGLIVTVIFDSCFSGGITRGQNMIVRGVRQVDKTPRPDASLVASPEQLRQNWRSLPKGARRGFRWLSGATGYVLLAACNSMEQAYEYPSDEYDGHGVFTYWLLDTFKHLGPNATYRMWHARIHALVHSEFEHQTPLIQGEADRVIFGSEVMQSEHAVHVLDVHMEEQQVQLQAGSASAIEKGAKFAVYPANVTDFSQVDMCLAVVEVIHLGGITSLARITERFRPDPLEPGAQAVLRDPGSVRLQRLVRLVHRDDLPPALSQDAALSTIEQAITQQTHKFVRLVEQHEVADYQVAINEQGSYEIWDPAGIAMQNIHPALSIHDNKVAQKLVRRLVHLAKYRNLQRLANNDRHSPLAGKLLISLMGKQIHYEPGDHIEPEAFAETEGNPILKPEEWTFLHIKNAYSRPLNITVFDLAPDWSVTQVAPFDEAYHTLSPGESYIVELQAVLPPGLSHGTDILKVFATIGSTDFQWLELPALDRPVQHRGDMRHYHPATPLEELLFALLEEAPETRNLKPGVRPTRDWITAQVEVDIQQQ